MSLTINSVPILVRSALRARGADLSNLRNPAILALVNPALDIMAHRIAEGKDYAGLQKDFTATPTSGFLDLSTLGTGALFDIARSLVKVTATGVPLTPLDSLYSLTNNPNLVSDQVYYAQDGGGLRFRATNGSLNTYATPLTITTNFIPSLGQLPFEYEGLFINTLIGLIGDRPAEQRAMELSEAGRA